MPLRRELLPRGKDNMLYFVTFEGGLGDHGNRISAWGADDVRIENPVFWLPHVLSPAPVGLLRELEGSELPYPKRKL